MSDTVEQILENTLSNDIRHLVDMSMSTEEHLPFIYNSWLASFRESDFAKRIRKNVYFNYQTARIDSLLKRSQVVVCHERGDTNNIYGWVCFENIANNITCLHYVMVKKSFRQCRIATELIKACREDDRHLLYYSHQNHKQTTRFVTPWLEIRLGFNYNPYLA